jgi:hypothetical protein
MYTGQQTAVCPRFRTCLSTRGQQKFVRAVDPGSGPAITLLWHRSLRARHSWSDARAASVPSCSRHSFPEIRMSQPKATTKLRDNNLIIPYMHTAKLKCRSMRREHAPHLLEELCRRPLCWAYLRHSEKCLELFCFLKTPLFTRGNSLAY